MGRVLLVYRLAARDLRRHAGQAVLLLLVIAATITTLTLALVLHGVTNSPWNRTFAATNGPDVVAQVYPQVPGPVPVPSGQGPKGHNRHAHLPSAGPAPNRALTALIALTRAARVTGHSGPIPTVNPVIATLVPAVRAARTSTIRSLNDPGRPPRRGPGLIALSARLPVPLLLGLRLASRRPRRTILATASLIITVAMIVAALTMRYGFDLRNATSPGSVSHLLNRQVQDRVSQVVVVLTVILGVLAAINTVFITEATVLDAQRPSALARAFGTTPRQVTAGLCVAQLFPAVVAVILGIPAGLGLYRLAAQEATHGHALALVPPVWWLLAVLPGTLLVVGVLTAIPARLGARRPVALVLRSE